MSFKSGVKGRGSDRWWERRWWLWRGDIRRMRWNQKESEQNEVDEMKGADSTGEVMHMW